MRAHGIEAILRRMRRLVRKPVTFELYRHCVVTCPCKRNEILPEHICRASPAMHQENGWIGVVTAFYCTQSKARPKSDIPRTQIGPACRKHFGRGKKWRFIRCNARESCF